MVKNNTDISEKMMTKMKKMFSLLTICIIVISGMLYYYCLHRSFWPDAEYMMRMYGLHLANYAGNSFTFPKMISGGVDYLVYLVNGYSIKSVRIEAMIIYGIVLFMAAVIALYNTNKKNINYSIIPLFVFLFIIINPGSTLYCGMHTDNFIMYPYDMHPDSTILAVLGLLLVFGHLNTKGKVSKLLLILAIILAVVGFKFSDMLFFVTFSCPLFFYFLLYSYHKYFKENYSRIQKKKIVFVLLICFSMLLMILKVAQWITGQDNGIYVNRADSGFADTTVLYENIFIVFTEILAVYNVELTGNSVLNIYNFVLLLRMALIFYVFKIVLTVAVTKIKDINNAKYDLLDFIISFGMLFNILFLICLHYGSSVRCIRYLIITFFYGAIILCIHIGKKVERANNNVEAKIFALYISIMVVVNMESFWKVDEYRADYEEPMIEMAKFIEENNLGAGGAGYWNADVLTAMAGGNNIVIDGIPRTDRYASRYCGIVDTIYYVIDSPYYPQDGIEYLGEPTYTYQYGDFVLYYYEDGIPVVTE